MKRFATSAVATMLTSAAFAEENADVCRALVLSGGGNNGAWEMGVLYGFVNYGNPADFTYDVVTGVSAGSINSTVISSWEKGDEVALAQYGSDLWRNLHTSDVWQDWKLGKVSGLTIMGGAVDNSPLKVFLRGILEQFDGFKRRVTISATDVNDGVYTEFNQKNMDFTQLSDAAVASASIPLVFPPFTWSDGRILMDGGTVYNINVEAAIRQCMDIVDDESKIVVDVFICGAPETPPSEAETGHSWENFFRGWTLDRYYSSTDSLAFSTAAHPTVNMRYVVKQLEGHMGGFSELNFEGDFTWAAQE